MHKEANNRIWSPSIELKSYSRNPFAGVANTAEPFTISNQGCLIACILQAVLACSASSVAQLAAAVVTYPEKEVYHRHCS